MKARIVTVFMFLLLLAVVPCVGDTAMCACPSGDEYSDNPNPCIVDALRSELTSAPIHQLQNAFYLSPTAPSMLILHTSMTVNVTCESSKTAALCEPSVLKFHWGHFWNQDNLAGVLMSEVFSARMFQTIDPVTSLLSLSEVQSKDSIISIDVNLDCESRGESNFESSLREIWEDILQWIKAYARAGGPVHRTSDSDKGQISCYDCPMKDVTFFAICLALHMILNIVVGVLLAAFIPAWIMKHNGSSATSSLFWSAAIVGALFFFAFIIGEVVVGVVNGNHYQNRTPLIFVVTTCTLLTFLLAVELIVAILRSKHSVLAIPRCLGYCCSIGCFCFFCCCRPGGRSHSRVARAISLWFVMAWLQLITSSAVPVTITILTSNPLLMLATLALVVSTVCCLVVFLAVLVHMCSQHDRSKHCVLFVYLVVLVGFLVTVCLVISLLLLITTYGAQVNSFGGFIATLVPSVIVSIITWLVKTKVLGEKPTEADPSNKITEEVPAEEKQGNYFTSGYLLSHRL